MIFIPHNVPSLKNSKIATTHGVFHSKTCRRYLQKIGVKKYGKTVEDYRTRENLFRKSVGNYFDNREYPIAVGFHFVRDSRRKFDFHNAVQILADLLVAHGFIVDDDMDHFLPCPLYKDRMWYSIDKQNPGVWLEIKDWRQK